MAAICGNVSSTSRQDIRRAVEFGFPGEVHEVALLPADLNHSPSPNKTYGMFWKGEGQILGAYMSRMERWKLQIQEEYRVNHQVEIEEAQQMMKKQYQEAYEDGKRTMEKQYQEAMQEAYRTMEKQFQQAYEDGKHAMEKQAEEAFQKMKDSYEQQREKETSNLLQELQQEWKDEFECKLCCSERRSRILFPCNHFRLCATCAAQVDGPCPWCRTPVQQIFQVIE